MSDRVRITIDVPKEIASHLAGALEVGADSGSPDMDEHVSDLAEGITDAVNNPAVETFEFVIH
ncbi:hypothetical protein [Sphingomonas melonis]|uniref:hypothetical protein n=1 Tax=Sphingomonas melonis TaxID=152682 RepID=UPI001FA40EC5|nr:hypothetical protein [Candidatus Sphingomonas excrementigallinarum]